MSATGKTKAKPPPLQNIKAENRCANILSHDCVSRKMRSREKKTQKQKQNKKTAFSPTRRIGWVLCRSVLEFHLYRGHPEKALDLCWELPALGRELELGVTMHSQVTAL